jgi:hypothetical protein
MLEDMIKQMRKDLHYGDKPPFDREIRVPVSQAMYDFLDQLTATYGGMEQVVRMIIFQEMKRTYTEWIAVNEQALEEERQTTKKRDDELDQLIKQMRW